MAADIAERLAAWTEQELKQERLELEQRHRQLVLELSQEVERVASTQHSVTIDRLERQIDRLERHEERRQWGVKSSVTSIVSSDTKSDAKKESAKPTSSKQLLFISLQRGPNGLGLELDATNTVVNLEPGGAADTQGYFREGDIIMSCDGIPLQGHLLQDVMDRGKNSYSFDVWRLTPVEAEPKEDASNDVLEESQQEQGQSGGDKERKQFITSARKRRHTFSEEPPHAKLHSNFFSKVIRSNAFEATFGVLILANAIFIGAEVQVDSWALSYSLGLNSNPDVNNWTQYGDDVFPAIEVVFGILFWIELLLKLLEQRNQFFCSGWNIFDTTVMVAWSVEKLASASLVVPPTLLRIFRLSRLLRLVRLFKQYELCDPLVLMVSSIKSSMWVLFWSVVLLGLIMIIMALVLNNLLKDFMSDPTRELDERQTVFRYFGSFTRSMLTCFETTLGNWVPPCWALVESVAEWYAFVFIAYKLLVGFAVLKCIGAIFLCETMKCASMNDEMMIQQKSRAKKKFVQKMTMLFHEADNSGDGVISRDEFVEIFANERIRFWLQAMDLNIHDPVAFFDMLDTEGDGSLSADELITGMARMRGSATQIRMVMTQRLIRDELSRLGQGLQDPSGRTDLITLKL